MERRSRSTTRNNGYGSGRFSHHEDDLYNNGGYGGPLVPPPSLAHRPNGGDSRTLSPDRRNANNHISPYSGSGNHSGRHYKKSSSYNQYTMQQPPSFTNNSSSSHLSPPLAPPPRPPTSSPPQTTSTPQATPLRPPQNEEFKEGLVKRTPYSSANFGPGSSGNNALTTPNKTVNGLDKLLF